MAGSVNPRKAAGARKLGIELQDSGGSLPPICYLTEKSLIRVQDSVDSNFLVSSLFCSFCANSGHNLVTVGAAQSVAALGQLTNSSRNKTSKVSSHTRRCASRTRPVPAASG